MQKKKKQAKKKKGSKAKIPKAHRWKGPKPKPGHHFPREAFKAMNESLKKAVKKGEVIPWKKAGEAIKACILRGGPKPGSANPQFKTRYAKERWTSVKPPKEAKPVHLVCYSGYAGGEPSAWVINVPSEILDRMERNRNDWHWILTEYFPDIADELREKGIAV